MDTELRAISKLVQERRYDEARPLLRAYLKQHPDQAVAWYLASYAEQQPAQRLAAARKAARLAPENAAAQERLTKLQSAAPRRLPLLALAAVLLIALVAAALFLLRPPPPAERESVPTLISLDATLPPTTQALAAETTTETPPSTAAASDTPAPPATATASATAALPASATASATPRPPTETQPPSETEIVVANVQPKPSLTPAPPTPTSASSPQPPSATPPPTATSVPPTPQPSPTMAAPGSVVPFGQPGNLGSGTLRVLSSTRAASSLIAELGGQAPAPPANQEWVLVELLLTCASGDNCTPPAAALSIVGGSGSSYSAPGTLRLDALFSPEVYASGQTWGYVGFLVSSSESTLSLVVTQDGQSVAFALQ